MVETVYYKTYSDLIKLPTFEQRFEYLALHGVIGAETFGSNRCFNQDFYRRKEWKDARRAVIIRDNGCDLGIADREIVDRIYVHHINPITIEDVLNARPILFDPENLICVSNRTHEAIHYGDKSLLILDEIDRKPNDTCPWRNNNVRK